MRWLFLLTIVLILSAFIFELSYRHSLKKLEKITRGEGVKIAKAVELILFNKEQPEWKFYGKEMDLSTPKEVRINGFGAEKIGARLKISSKKAIFYIAKRKIYLYGDVNLLSIRRGKEFSVEVSKAVVDLNRQLVIGYGPFKGKEGNRTVKGVGFIYSLKDGTFKIEKDVETSINLN